MKDQYLPLSRFGYANENNNGCVNEKNNEYDLVNILNTVMDIYNYKKIQSIKFNNGTCGGSGKYLFMNIALDLENSEFIKFTKENAASCIEINFECKNRDGSINRANKINVYYKN